MFKIQISIKEYNKKEEENLYFNNLGLDYDESISLFNKKEIIQDKNELNLKESKNLFTTALVKKVIKKTEVYPLKQATNPDEVKKEILLPIS